ncbi:B12-binding domain-containing radical SAM protein [Butyrivibrio proteoclasticus]|uniref:B12-binding domain-containing radical SAM protein n=1 Tax=Butyrivibrio proteoclasticus TaxID=43305 RepID=UPI00047AA91A|nr:B12-binding domain-containing radical SAM protein [Butyrivibrio proteoclasticus]
MKRNDLCFLLIHPEISRTRYNFVGVIENECLELEQISIMLKKKGHRVYLYDGQVEKISVPEALKMYKPDVVYVCGRTRQENFMLEYCQNAKDYNPNTLTIIGGLHVQLAYQRMYRDYVDYILTSFDIYKILDLVDYSIFQNQHIVLKEISGICYKEDGQWHYNKQEPFDIDLLPAPDRSYFYAHPDNYRYLELKHAAWVRTAFSCPYHCRFCARNRMNAGAYSRRNIDAVVDEIEQIESDNIYIVDDDFLFDEERLKRFITLIKKRKIKKRYICYGRSDFIARHKKLMRKLRDIGLYYVLVGLEAFDDSYLTDYNKRSSMENNSKTIEICNELGINIMGMFILDLGFTGKDFRNLYRYIREHSLKHVAVSIFTPEFGLETYNKYKDRIITDNPSHFDYLHVVAKPDKISVKRFYFHYYVLLIRLFLRAQRQGIYDFINYGDYIRSFVLNMFRKRKNDNE